MANLNVPTVPKVEKQNQAMGITHVDTSRVKTTMPGMTHPDNIPANWDLKVDEQDDTIIHGVNLNTHKTFDGTRKEFGKMIRGE
jgi:hypothetical protein